jgi:hypothetical protein
MLSRLYCLIYGPLESIGFSNFISLDECPPYILTWRGHFFKMKEYLQVFNFILHTVWMHNTCTHFLNLTVKIIKCEKSSSLPSHLFVLNQRQLKWSSNNFFTFSGCKCLRLQVQPRFSTKYLQMLFMLSYTEQIHCTRRKQLLLQKHKLVF